MKIVGFICVYEDEDYLDQCIRSIKDKVDELVIVEGAFQITMQCGKPARSPDRTIEIIDSHVDGKRVFKKHVNLREHKDHYQVGLDFAKERGADWALLVDSDEIWTSEAWTLAKARIAQADRIGAYEFRIREYSFINDFKTFYFGEYPRLFKVTPEAHFVADNEVLWSDHGKMQDCGKVEGHIHLLSPSVKIFHYGYVRRKARWKLKQDYMLAKDGNPINLQYKLEGDKYIIPADIPIYEFQGQHPEVMRNHQFHGRTANEIIHGEQQ